MSDTSTVTIRDLMRSSGVGFGTSGARGLVSAMTDRVCYAYTLAFLQHHFGHTPGMNEVSNTGCSHRVAVAGDLRPSTPDIMCAVFRAIEEFGAEPINCGFIPSPAVALFGIEEGIPSIMVTGSHIPDDRNGIKFNLPGGEILKRDEAAIRAQTVSLAADLFDGQGTLRRSCESPAVSNEAYDRYLARYLEWLPSDALANMRIGLYQHSGVARDMLGEILQGLGAEVLRLGRSETFVPVDTEAIRDEDVELARQWCAEHRLDALVSTDGDADRPLISDQQGNWLRGDVVGVLCARYLNADALATPVSCNTLVEKCGWFQRVQRTRIGSPYVIAGMEELCSEGFDRVVGYEANGGFLVARDLQLGGVRLARLPTRDAVLPILSILLLSQSRQLPIAALLDGLPHRFTCSGRLKQFPTEISQARIAALATGCEEEYPEIEELFGALFGPLKSVDLTDGLRMTFDNDDVVHLRPSGNAPELRCYTESGSDARARSINSLVLEILKKWI